MRVILGGVAQTTLDGSRVRIVRSMTDPVPTCQLTLIDNASSISPQAMQELLVLDDQVTPNPTVNLLLNPQLASPNSQYGIIDPTVGVSVTGLNPGYQFSLNNNPVGSMHYFQNASAAVGQLYVFSAYVTISPAFTNASAFLGIVFLDSGGNTLAANQQFLTGIVSPVGSQSRKNLQATAPAGAAYVQVQFGLTTTNTTNSGAILWNQLQLEPLWFPTLSYPTPWCGPSQTNVQQLPSGLFIRQYRKFAGFVTHVLYDSYHGNVRQVHIDAVGYAWLAGLILANDNFTSKSDSTIITSLLSTYLNGFCTTTNIVTGVSNVTNLQANWDDLRTLFDGLCGLSGFYWTIDFYWNFVYAPPGYFAMPISLICDNSATPDMKVTFPAYNFSREMDFTQPGSTILTIGGTSGSTTFSAELIDPSTTAQYGITSGYTFTSGKMFMRKVNDSTLLSNTDCTQRSLAELLQFDNPRNVYHLTTNVELLAGESIQVTSATDGLSSTSLLLQQVTTQWLGTNETLTDEWEYVADLGAVNRAATKIMSRIFRQTQRNTSAPAIGVTTLALLESLGIVESAATAATTTSYVGTVQGDGPTAYYRLSNLEGTVADDWSGNGNTGTIVNAPTLGVATLLTDSAAADTSDFAMTFAGASSQQITLPTGMIPTGASPWSLECWFKITSIPTTGFPTLMGWGASTGNQKFGVLNLKPVSGNVVLNLSTNNGDIQSGNLSTNTIYYAVGTYDGTSTRLYLNGSLVAGPTAFTLSLTQTLAQIGSYTGYGSSFFSGTIDEVAFYTFALNSTQISNHYTVGI